MNVNSDSNGDINSASRIRGRQRSLSDTSDTTVVPATFAKDTKALKGASNEPLATRHRTPLSFPPRNNDDKIRTTNASSSNILTPPTSDSSTSQESIKQRSSSSHKSTYATFNHHAPSSSSAAQTLSPRALQTLLVSLQLLSLVPAIVGGIYCIYRAILPQTRPMPLKGGLVKTLEWNRRVEWLLCAMWAGLSGNYCHSMARGLTRRWLVYYPLPAAVIRLVSLQVICWPLTKFTVVNFFGKDDLQLPAWIVCAVTAAISNTIQIWVTSNLRFLLVSGASSHPASWASRLPAAQRRIPTPPSSASALNSRGSNTPLAPADFALPRGLRSKQVIKQTVLPIATCSFCTLLWALVEVYSMRGSKLYILSDSNDRFSI
ncbi:hypothetical protein P389DRAFT_191715 [Cystobasidium minutum MCA 4210]|uniref:uncharacterized protein n=1 Tax=Cystobasidium minutum MCA 4210 TaxID=1397322 RepID=UPI0034CE2AFA|eukprot:jgi/Rhomi1/191715/estExt_fgenesh1_pg.C_110031